VYANHIVIEEDQVEEYQEDMEGEKTIIKEEDTIHKDMLLIKPIL